MKPPKVIVLLIFFTLIFLSFSYQNTFSQQDPYFRIYENGKFGFIDSTGKVFIEPTFLNAGDFYDGLAPARLNGTFGYIDITGNYVIPPIYDYAEEFRDSVAIVYIDSLPFFIDIKGNKLFDAKFKSVRPFRSGLSIVESMSGKFGAVNKTGNIIVDTVYAEIIYFSEGMVVAKGFRHNLSPDKKKNEVYASEISVIDSTGKIIVPFGVYEEIEEFKNGYALVENEVERKEGSSLWKKSGFIDKNGRLLFWYPNDSQTSLKKFTLNDGIVIVDFYEEKNNGDLTLYNGGVDSTGKMVFKNKLFYSVNNFRKSRAIVIDSTRNILIINIKGEILNKFKISRIPVYSAYYYNENGLIVAEVTRDNYIVIDTNVNIISNFKDLEPYTGLNSENYFVFEKNEYVNKKSIYTYGVADIYGNVIIPAEYDQLDSRRLFRNGLIVFNKDNRQGYLNRQGEIVWEQKYEEKFYDTLNIDFMRRGYFYAYDDRDYKQFKKEKDTLALSRLNFLKPNVAFLIKNQGKLNFYVEPSNGKYKLFLLNDTKDTLIINVQDNRLYIKVQALDSAGNWRDIEYIPNSWESNSYYSIKMKPKFHWTFNIYAYKGEFQTKLRVMFEYSSRKKDAQNIILYSNEFDGSINPAQFWRRMEYYPSDVMDPYNE